MVVTGPMEAVPGGSEGAAGRGVSTTSLLSQLDKFLTLALTASDKRSHGGRRDAISEGEEQSAAETALFLLRNLPPARPAALAYLAHTLSRQVSSHMRGHSAGEGSRKPDAPEEGLPSQLEVLLGDLLESTPGVWGPLVSQWAVEQLGRWSVEWANAVVGRGDATLEEVVAGWLSCGPARTLASLSVVCVAHDPDAAVAALLDAGAASGPALDWLVAHVGCSFPATVISRVLALGLRGFASFRGRTPEHQLASVNKILSHLADRHLPDIRRGLHAILLRTFDGASDPEARASVPFLLCLAVTSRSRAVLAALTSGLDALLMPGDRLASLAGQVSWWVPRYFPSHGQLQEMVVHLVLDTGGSAAPSLLRLLLQGAAPSPRLPPAVAASVNEILQGVVGEICMVTYMRRNSGSSRIHIPFLVGLRGGGLDGSDVGVAVGGRAASPVVGVLEDTLAAGGHSVVGYLKQFITLVVVQQGPATAGATLGHLLHCGTRESFGRGEILSSVVTALTVQPPGQQPPRSSLSAALSGALRPHAGSATIPYALESLEALLRQGRLQGLHTHPALTEALLVNLPLLAELINSVDYGPAAVRLLCQLPLRSSVPVGHVLSLAHAVVFYFFSCLHESQVAAKICGVGRCQRILGQLSESSLALNHIVRLLVEGVFRPECSALFGGGGASAAGKGVRTKKPPGDDLIGANRQFNSWVKAPQSHTSIFHMGVIGGGRPDAPGSAPLPPDAVRLHRQLVLNTLSVCCSSRPGGEGAASVALLLVELISPDIMFNGFPWPEEYIKFTFERDLAIKKTFEDYPVAWALLEFVASHRAALGYCSVLARALTASLVAFWSNCPLARARQAPEALGATRSLLEVMATAQFLPGPLRMLPQMVDALAPFELVCVLQDVWMYMRDHTPSPDRWTELPSGHYRRVPEGPVAPCHTERIRHIIQSNVSKLGHLMSYMVLEEH